MPLLLLTLACGSRPDHGRELAACQLISKSGDELARCLIMKYSWGADSAAPAKISWQWHLDSIRQEHEEQVAALILAEARKDSIREYDDSVRFAQQQHLANARMRQREQARIRIDSMFSDCVDSAFAKGSTSGKFNYAEYQPFRIRCGLAWKEARKRAGLPTDTEP